MSLTMNRHLSVAILGLACWALVSCLETRSPVTREAVVGSYIYVSEDPSDTPTNHEFDQLTLRADGTYNLREGGRTKTVIESKGRWSLEPGAPPDVDAVIFHHTVYPVAINGHQVRLLIDLDTGISWLKTQ